MVFSPTYCAIFSARTLQYLKKKIKLFFLLCPRKPHPQKQHTLAFARQFQYCPKQVQFVQHYICELASDEPLCRPFLSIQLSFVIVTLATVCDFTVTYLGKTQLESPKLK